MSQSQLVATGSYLPAQVILNDDLIKFPPQARKLIEVKTGIKARRIAAEHECTSDLAVAAARDCLSKGGLDSGDLDAIILATSSPDRIQPATATRVQDLLGAKRAFSFDLNSVCSGAIYAMTIADSLIRSDSAKTVLVIGAELYSRFLNPDDFSTFPYFGDGAGATLVQATDGRRGIIATALHSDGSGRDLIQIPSGGSMRRSADGDRSSFFTMDGKAVYAFATRAGADALTEVAETSGIPLAEVAWVVAHQANVNIIRDIANRTGIPFSRFMVNLDRYGNTAAASPLIALDELASSGRLREGDAVALVAFGGGLSWGATMIRW